MTCSPAALQIPEVVPMVEQQGEGEDKDWQRWLQDLFNCGEMFISWCLSMITVVSVISHAA